MSDDADTGARLPDELAHEIRAAIMNSDDPQSVANDLLTIAIASCVALSQGSSTDAVSIYKATVHSLNELVHAARKRNLL